MKENNEIGEQLHGTELNVFLLYQSIKGGTRHSRKKENCVFLTCMLTTRLCYINNMVLLVRLLKNDRKSPCLVGH